VVGLAKALLLRQFCVTFVPEAAMNGRCSTFDHAGENARATQVGLHSR